MKKVFSSLLVMLMLFASVPAYAQDIMVVIDEQEQSYDQNPVIDNGRTLVPIRGIF
ncbi:hypothetical protein [Halalkalibacter urbisdiaboli]|uniref:hypothetical protein n=1 Tax=Halalkalibacter urbisdiaboli TaxID=1960589 RepID=UPI001A981472|nr:hypothetical protein [Halalkalibacter urbisdiaboli]